VKRGLPGDAIFGGALGTTLLLALATPMVVFPVERILKAIEGKRTIADDRAWGPVLSDKVLATFTSGRSLAQTDFVSPGKWSYLKGLDRFDIGGPWPDGVLNALAHQGAFHNANEMQARQFIVDLRNALSHGGVTYLNAAGHHVYDDEAKMLAFAAHDTGRGGTLNILRVTEDDFRDFLTIWSKWLNDT